MLRSKRVKIIISVIFVSLFVISSSLYILLKDESVLGITSTESEKEKNVSLNSVPYIVSVAPISFEEGDIYEYVPKFSDSDTDSKDLILELIEAPNWLFIDDHNIVKGTIPLGGSETYMFVLKVSDGYNSSIQENYIVVEEKDE